MLFACYRKDEAVNPEIYAAAIGAVLSEYPDDVVLFVTDPRTGIASKSKWLPAVSEVKEACDLEVERLASAAKRARDLAEQLAERNRYEAEQASKGLRTPEQQAKVDAHVAEWNAKRAEMERERKEARPNLSADNTPFLLGEYKAAGVAPVYTSAGQLISLDLSRSLATHRQKIAS